MTNETEKYELNAKWLINTTLTSLGGLTAAAGLQFGNPGAFTAGATAAVIGFVSELRREGISPKILAPLKRDLSLAKEKLQRL